MPDPIYPSITVDIDFPEPDESYDYPEPDMVEPRLQTFLSTIPGRNSAQPVVEYIEDDQARYLRATFWLAAYDEQLARDAGAAVYAWAAEQRLNCRVMF